MSTTDFPEYKNHEPLSPEKENEIAGMSHTERVALRDRLHDYIRAHNARFHTNQWLSGADDPKHTRCGNGERG
jgi:hypothetical protein